METASVTVGSPRPVSVPASTARQAPKPASPRKPSAPLGTDAPPLNATPPNSQNHHQRIYYNRQDWRRNEPNNERDRTNSQQRHKIQVSGYPDYTRRQDLTHAFSEFGNVKIDYITDRMATLSFGNKEEATNAIKAARRISIYGDVISVKPFSEKEFRQEQTRELYPKSKQKGEIIDPKLINLSGDFHTQFDMILATIRLTQEEVTSLSALYSDIEHVLQEQWPGCRAIPFGSITNGLGIKSSDADCFVCVPPRLGGNGVRGSEGVLIARKLLLRRPRCFAEVLAIPRANTPIVKLFHLPTQTNCDLTFKTPLGVQNSRMTAFLLHVDPRAVPLAVVIKYWAKVHQLSGTGKLTNYALTLMIIFYLQQPPVRLLPSVRALQCDPRCDEIVDHWNTGISRDPRLLPSPSTPHSIADLLGGFFQYYSLFNFEKLVVCPYLGCPIEKDLFKDRNLLPASYERYKANVANGITYAMRSMTSICVQDPFEQCHNVSSAISRLLAAEIVAYFKFAAAAYEKERADDCKEFLRVILLEKPKIPRNKGAPDFRVNLYTKIVAGIVDPDWQAVVKQHVFTICEKIMKIKLNKVEEKESEDTEKQKEKYEGSVKTAIWKRKPFARLYAKMKIGFLDKETKITEEIIKVDKQPVNFDFSMTVTFRESKSAVVRVKLTNGDLEAFREFGKFFMSVMQNWFFILVQINSNPQAGLEGQNTENLPTDIPQNLTNAEDDTDSDEETDEDISSGSKIVVENGKLTETQKAQKPIPVDPIQTNPKAQDPVPINPQVKDPIPPSSQVKDSIPTNSQAEQTIPTVSQEQNTTCMEPINTNSLVHDTTSKNPEVQNPINANSLTNGYSPTDPQMQEPIPTGTQEKDLISTEPKAKNPIPRKSPRTRTRPRKTQPQ